MHFFIAEVSVIGQDYDIIILQLLWSFYRSEAIRMHDVVRDVIFRQDANESLELITIFTDNNHPGIRMNICKKCFIFCMEMENIFQYGYEGAVLLVFQPADHIIIKRCSVDHVLDKPPAGQMGPDSGMPCRVIHKMDHGIRYSTVSP